MKKYAILVTICAVILLLYIDNGLKGHLDNEMMIEDYNYMWKMLEENSPFIELAERKLEIRRESIYSDYKEKLKTIKNDDIESFYSVLKECLEKFQFLGHISVVDPETVLFYQDIAKYDEKNMTLHTQLFLDKRVKKTYSKLYNLFKNKQNNFKYNYLNEKKIILDWYGDTPVITIKSFATNSVLEAEYMVESLLECLEQCKDSEDIIFDLRGNPGGNSAIWKNGILPCLGYSEISLESFSVCKNSLYNQIMCPINIKEDKEYISGDVTYDIESWDLDTDTNIHSIMGPGLSGLVQEDIKKCDLLFRTQYCLKIYNPCSWRLKGKIWIFMDERTASSAMDMGWFFQKAGLASIVGNQRVGFIGGFSLPPVVSGFILPRSGIIIQYSPYYIFNSDGSCTELGMKSDIIENDLRMWLWKEGKWMLK